jgi:hypothetical protein
VAWHYDTKGMFFVRLAYQVHREHLRRNGRGGVASIADGNILEKKQWKIIWKLKFPGKVKQRHDLAGQAGFWQKWIVIRLASVRPICLSTRTRRRGWRAATGVQPAGVCNHPPFKVRGLPTWTVDEPCTCT